MDFKMKKTLAALAVLGAFAGSAMAADVTLYGAVDTGFEYIHTKSTGEKGVDTFDMQTGWDTPSRWGLKGSEDLGNGYKVSASSSKAALTAMTARWVRAIASSAVKPV